MLEVGPTAVGCGQEKILAGVEREQRPSPLPSDCANTSDCGERGLLQEDCGAKLNWLLGLNHLYIGLLLAIAPGLPPFWTQSASPPLF